MPLFRGRQIRQEIELALAVDQDRDQRLAVLCEQDVLPPFFGAQPDPERKTDRPIAHDDAVIIDHEDRTIGPIGEDVQDGFHSAQFGAVLVQRRLRNASAYAASQPESAITSSSVQTM